MSVELSRNLTLHSVPPPGSGLLMSFILKILDGYNLSLETDNEKLRTYHLITEAFKFAFAKRTHLGDPFDPSVTEIVKEVNETL